MNMYRQIVIKLTGHLFNYPSVSDELFPIINFIKKDHIENKRVYYLVVGGGAYARYLIENLRKQGVNEYLLDKIGIETSRLHAHFIISLLKPHTYNDIPKSIHEAVLIANNKHTNIVMGGLYPGYSTNAVSALLASHLNADILITMTRAGGLYDRDPKVNKDAKLLKEVSIDRAENILGGFVEKAGYYPLLDKVSLKIIKENKINVYIIPSTLEALKQVIEGKNPGSHITH